MAEAKTDAHQDIAKRETGARAGPRRQDVDPSDPAAGQKESIHIAHTSLLGQEHLAGAT